MAYEDYATLVELDGRAAHPESSRDLDTRRDNANVADGWATLRYGWIEVSEHSCEVATQLARTLRRRGWPGSLRPCSAPAASLRHSGASPARRRTPARRARPPGSTAARRGRRTTPVRAELDSHSGPTAPLSLNPES